jgi:flagellar basal body-associated protein FliL
LPAQPQMPDRLRRDHSNVSAGQYEVQFNNLFQADQQQAAPPNQPVSAGPTQQSGGAYDFILSPEQPTKPQFSLPGGGSKLIRIAFIGGALLVLIILFSLLKSLFSSSADTTPYVSVAQDQQALIQLAQNASLQKDLSTTNKNYTYTASLSLTSAQAELLKYLSSQKHKVDKKKLNLKVSASTSTQLTNALAAGTYNQTYHDLAESKLKTYLNDLDHAYKTSSGPKGRALLKTQTDQAELLLKQLNAPTS